MRMQRESMGLRPHILFYKDRMETRINAETRLSLERCSMANTILGIAIAEMMHLQKLGEWICLLGGKLDFVARPREGRPRMWTPEYLNLQESVRGILTVSVE